MENANFEAYLIEQNENLKRTRCPQCNFEDFCMKFGQVWKSSDAKICENKQPCLNKDFKEDIQRDIEMNSNMNVGSDCKHMTCKSCKKSYLCGEIAEIQQLSNS